MSNELLVNHCEMVTPYMATLIWVNTGSGNSLVPNGQWHQDITWTNIDISSKVFCCIHLREISQEVLLNLIHNMYSDITL